MTMLNIVGHTTIAGGSVQVGPEFSPSSLFAASEVGVWYDPSDFSTLFQNTNGTSPVTAVEQPVGLMLDKSQGLVLGSELVTNGTFDADSDWTKGTGWTISGGKATKSAGTTSNLVTSSPVVSAGKTYLCTFSVSDFSAGYVTFYAGLTNSGTAQITADGDYAFYLRGGSSDQKIYIQGSSAFGGSIDNVSVKLVPGNHAVAANNSTARPVLRSRYNLLTQSEYPLLVWTNINSTLSNTSSGLPNNIENAVSIIPNTVPNSVHGLRRNSFGGTALGLPIGNTIVVSVIAKANGYNFLQFIFTCAGGTRISFDLSTGLVGTVGASWFNAGMTNLGGGWYRCFASADLISLATNGNDILAAPSNNVGNFSGNDVDGILVTGIQIVSASVFPQNTYQRIAAATDYATGADFPPYLAFTTDDAMSTASIDFSGSDEMSVFAGVTKNSDAASGFLAESSANVDNNNGTFFLLAPSNNGANSYRYGSKGTVFAAAGTGVFVAAPDTAVLSGLSDISGDTATLRRNGSVVETSTADQGTGNFGNYPLYIGARGGSSLFLNGSLYSLIVRGKTSTAQEIDDTEAWVADKTGVTL